MKKTFIKLVSILTAIMIVSGMLAGIDFSANAADQVLFEDNFDHYATLSSNANRKTAFESKGWGAGGGWNNTKAGYAATGAYVTPDGYEAYLANMDVTGAGDWADYAVEADVKYNSVPETRANNSYALLVMNTTVVNAGGYEFGFSYESDGNKFLIIRRRKNGDEYSGETLVSKNYDFDTTNATSYKLKFYYDNGVLKGSVNGTLELSYNISSDDVKLTKGYGGFRKNGKDCEVSFDNFRLYQITDEYFNMPFTGTYTGSALTAMGYSVTGDTADAAAGYISNGVIKYPNTRTATSAFYYTGFDKNNYTVEATAKVDALPSGDATFGITAGETTTKHKTGFYFYLTINKTAGTIQATRLSYLPDYSSSDTSTYATESIASSNRPAMGTNVNLKLTISYDSANNTTTATGVLSVEGNPLSTLTISRTGNISGYSALYVAKTCAVSLDDFKAMPIEAPKDENIMFFDDFEDTDSMTDNGWSSNSANAGTKADGVYTLAAGQSQYTSGVTDAATWTDYAVTAKVKLNATALPTDDKTYVASIVARSTNKHSEGFEFGIRANKNGTYFQLYKRGNSGGKINGEDVKLTKEITLTDTHNLKMIVMGTRVLCWYGDELIFDVTDKQEDNLKYDAGYAGIRSATATPAFDDFTVRKITDQEKQEIEALTPVTPPDGGDDGDDGDDTPTDENIIYEDKFENSKPMAENGWNSNSAGTKADGVYTLGYNKAAYLTKVEGGNQWDDYVVETDMRYNNATIEQGVATVVSIVARSTSTVSNGYEFGFGIDGEGNTYLRLYKRGNSAGKINGTENKLPYTILPDTDYHAKMVVLGDRIICYFNGIKVFDVVDNEEKTYFEGYAGLRNAGANNKTGYTSTYDNFVVRKILTTDIVDDKKIEKLEGDIWFQDNFNGETSLSERGWNSDAAEFKNGTASLVRTTNAMYISGVEGSEKWTDYTVTATVEIDKSQGTFGGQTMGASWIVARSTKTTGSGYEYGIMSYSSGKYNLRLYDRTDKEDIMVVDGYDVSDGAHELKMICQANVIRCYFDGELVMTATDDTNKAGYAGVRASGYITNYDNFTVSAIKEEQKLDIVAPENDETVKSPVTGVARVTCTVIAPISFAISALALIITAVWAIVNRKKIF